MFLTPVVENEIINIVKLCKPKHSKDCDDISTCVIYTGIIPISNLLLIFLIYHSLVGVFPDHMKIAKMIPMLKIGQETEFTNSKQISILS